MSRHAFDKIKAGVEHAIAIARGEADPASYRVHIPEEVDVKAIRRKLGMSQWSVVQRAGCAGPELLTQRMVRSVASSPYIMT